MNITDHKVFINGGGSSLGRAPAEALLERGNRVMVCGRDAGRLEQAKERRPELHRGKATSPATLT